MASLLQMLGVEGLASELSERKSEDILRLLTEDNPYRTLLQEMPDAVLAHHNERIVYYNPAAEELFRTSTRSQLLGRDPVELAAPEEVDEILKRRAQIRTRERISGQAERKFHRLDGTPFYSNTFFLNIGNPDDPIFLVMFRDVTEPVETRRALKMGEEQFRASFDEAHIGMALVETDGTIRHVNNAYCRLLQYDREEISGLSFKELTHPDDVALNNRMNEEVLSGKRESFTMEKRYFRKDGQLVWVDLNVTMVRNEAGAPSHFVAQVVDITQEKAANLALDQRRKLETLISRTAVASNDAKSFTTALRIALDGVRDVAGWPVAHAYYRGDDGFFHTTGVWSVSDRQKYADFMTRSEEHAIPQQDTLPGEVLKSARSIWLVIEDQPKRGPRRDWVRKEGFVCTVLAPVMIGTDIAAFLEFFIPENQKPDEFMLHTLDQIGSQLGRVLEREQAARELIIATQTAEHANRAKTEFLANMSHELRSPLTAILGFTEVMQDGLYGKLGSPKYQEYTDNIMKSAEHLHAIINDLLDVSAIESGHKNMREDAVNLSGVISSAVRMMFQRAESAGLALENEADPDLPLIRGDDRRIKQVLVNLLANAVRFTDPGGKITVSSARTDDGCVAITVTDTGIGMDEAGIAKAMTVFGQVESGLSRGYEGTGLGLPLSKGLVEAHDGTLSIESRIGKGTAVSFTLPAARIITTP